MSDLKLFASAFEGHAVHTLTVDGRPAWMARELGAILGYSQDGLRLARKITTEWSEDFVAGHDFALLLGSDLAAVQKQCDAVPPSARSLVVLFESGLHLALVKTHQPLGRRLRRFLVDEILPGLVRTGASAPLGGTEPDPDYALSVRGLRADFEDRRFRSRTLRQTADALSALGRLDQGQWAVCVVRACEIALGHALPQLHGAIDHDWVDGTALALRLGVPVRRIHDAMNALCLFRRSTYVRPLPTHDGPGWTLAFRLSPEAVALVEAWLAEQGEQPVAVTA